MTYRSIGTRVAAAALSALLAAPAWAAERELVDRVKGWEIERAVSATDAHPCQISKSYKDKNDSNAENVIVLALTDDSVVVSLGYQHWTWDKDEKIKVPFSLDNKVVNASSRWTGDGTTLYATFPNALVPKLQASREMILRFPDGDADFDLAGFPDAFEALKLCDRSAPAATAAAPPMPSDVRIKVYLYGLMIQENIKECDVKSTGQQRSDLDARVATLKPEMVAMEASLRDSLKNRPAPHCPPAEDAAKFEETLQAYIAKSPEDFAAEMDRKQADAKAATPKP